MVQESNEQFKTTEFPYEIVLGETAVVANCNDDNTIPHESFHFIKLNQVSINDVLCSCRFYRCKFYGLDCTRCIRWYIMFCNDIIDYMFDIIYYRFQQWKTETALM